MNESLHIVTEVAIGLLALSIGGEFSVRKIRRIGRKVAVITIVHILLTILLVTLGCMLLDLALAEFEMGFPYALLLGVIACAVSPAIIIAEVHHMRAHGPFVDYLYGMVALGDAITAVVFGFVFTLVTNILDPRIGMSFMLGRSLREIGLSVVCGFVCALLLGLLTRRLRNPDELLIVLVGVVFAVTGISVVLHFSPLLVHMTMGVTLTNLSSRSHSLLRPLERLTPPIYALFFVLAGLELDPSIVTRLPILGVGGFYVLLRAVSKRVGTEAGCRCAGVEPRIAKNLGYCTLAQGGVALGFVLLIQTSPALAALRTDQAIYRIFSQLVGVIMLSIFVNEMASPFFLRAALVRGNEMEET
jgi:Kef-type K+ transport system membrane component KefB